MKLFFLLAFLSISAVLLSQDLSPGAIVMCSNLATAEEATCTGSANCRACKNCKYCKHCNSGGSCGVCGGGGRTYRSSTPSSRSVTTASRAYGSTDGSGVYHLPDDRFSEYYAKTLIVTNEYLNMRSGPSTDYRIIQRLKEGQRLTFLAMTGSWVKVRTVRENTPGFVHMKYVAVATD